MTVSALILCYNFQDFIAETINSVLNQEVAADEIIVVDDCSTDGSMGILRSYGDKIKIVSTPQNYGVLRAELLGYRSCACDLVCLLGGDDIWLPGKIGSVKSKFQAEPELMLAIHDYACINKFGKRILGGTPAGNRIKELSARMGPNEMDQAIRHSILTWGGLAFFGNLSLRKEYVDLVKFQAIVDRLENPLLTYDDTTLATFLVLNNDRRFGFIDEVLYEYRLHDNNMSMSFSDPIRTMKVLERGYWSHKVTYDLIKDEAAYQTEAAYQLKLVNEKKYLLYLYQRRIFKATRSYIGLVKYFSKAGRLGKESLRFFLITFFGVKLFHKIKKQPQH